MKRLSCVILLIAMILNCGYGAASDQSNSKPDHEALARQITNELVDGHFDRVCQRFDETMAKALSEKDLQNAWDQVIQTFGPFKEINNISIKTEGGLLRQSLTVASVVGTFTKQPIEIRIAFDDRARIAGLFFLPASSNDNLYKSPAYVNRKAFTEKEVQVGKHKLPGVITIPNGKSKVPGVVLVHGSGPQDRDETIGSNKPFKDIAEGLSSLGVAVLRYDKRTFALGAKAMPPSARFTVMEETVEDAIAAVDLLASDQNVDPKRVYILGHSLGGMLAPRIAKNNPKIAGMIILAGSVRPMEELVLEQITFLANIDGKIDPQEKERIDKCHRMIEQIRSPNLKEDDVVNFLGAKIPGSYWLDLMEYDPKKEMASLSLPTLILQGTYDYQVTEKDFDGWKSCLSNRKDATFRLLPNLNHLFIRQTDPPSPEATLRPGNVDEGVIKEIAGWLNTDR